jgi:hypothetical protein
LPIAIPTGSSPTASATTTTARPPLGLFRVSRDLRTDSRQRRRAQADALILHALEELQLWNPWPRRVCGSPSFSFPAMTPSMNNLMDLFYFAGDRSITSSSATRPRSHRTLQGFEPRGGTGEIRSRSVTLPDYADHCWP